MRHYNILWFPETNGIRALIKILRGNLVIARCYMCNARKVMSIDGKCLVNFKASWKERRTARINI